MAKETSRRLTVETKAAHMAERENRPSGARRHDPLVAERGKTLADGDGPIRAPGDKG